MLPSASFICYWCSLVSAARVLQTHLAGMRGLAGSKSTTVLKHNLTPTSSLSNRLHCRGTRALEGNALDFAGFMRKRCKLCTALPTQPEVQPISLGDELVDRPSVRWSKRMSYACQHDELSRIIPQSLTTKVAGQVDCKECNSGPKRSH